MKIVYSFAFMQPKTWDSRYDRVKPVLLGNGDLMIIDNIQEAREYAEMMTEECGIKCILFEAFVGNKELKHLKH